MFTQNFLAAGTAAMIGQDYLHIAMHVNATHASNHADGIATASTQLLLQSDLNIA